MNSLAFELFSEHIPDLLSNQLRLKWTIPKPEIRQEPLIDTVKTNKRKLDTNSKVYFDHSRFFNLYFLERIQKRYTTTQNYGKRRHWNETIIEFFQEIKDLMFF